MKIKKPVNETEASSEPVRTSNYVGLQHDEPGMQYDAHDFLLQLRQLQFLLHVLTGLYM